MAGLSVAVVCLGASVWPPGAASASPPASPASASAQIAALQGQLAASAARIRALTLSYQQANTAASALAAQVASDRAEVARLESEESATRQALRLDAILSYTGSAGMPTEAPTPGHSGTADPAIRAEYAQVAAGDLSGTVDRFRAEEARIAAAQATLASEQRASLSAATAVESARTAALSAAAAVESQIAGAQARLAALEAQAAAEAARQAALRAAAARVAQPAAPQGTPVNSGLLDVVRTVVSPAPAPAPSAGSGGVWLQLRECESGNNYQANTGNGFYGAYQFSESTWQGLGYPGRPDLEPPAMQDQGAQRLQAQSGWGQWPACSAALGLH